MAPLNRFPRRLLRRTVLGLFRHQPADRGGIEEELCAGERGEPRRLRVPLVPADEHARLGKPGVPRAVAEIARREVELFVIVGVVRNVHLPVLAQVAAVGIEDGGRIVIEPLGPLLEKRGDDHDAQFAREPAESLGTRAWHRLGEREEIVVLRLAEVRAAEQLGQADHLRAALRRITNACDRAGEVLLRVRGHPHLDEAEDHLRGIGGRHGAER